MLENLFSLPRFVNPAKPAEVKFNINQPNTMFHIAANVRNFLTPITDRAIIILCIGTDRSTGDSLGPLTGTKLRSLNQQTQVYGTLDSPVHATNLHDTLATIHTQYEQPYIIAVDACLGRMENVGFISVGSGSVKPGTAVKKELPSVGNAYITGVVNVGGFMEHWVLQSTRLHLVMKMADTIAHGITIGLRK